MMQRIVLLAIVAITLMSCGGSPKTSTVPLTKEADESAVAGVLWSYPTRWSKGAARMMRAATYTIPGASEGSEGGECAVFFFGAGQGGDVDLNLQRWEAQFENGTTKEKNELTVDEVQVTTVVIEGSYLSPSGPMMQSQGLKENYKLLGAVIQAPGGMVFFKLTGPKAIADEATEEFNAMVGSIVRHP